MLEGYDDDWQNADKKRLAYYSDVPAGTYTFKVKAFLLESPEKYDLRTIEVVVEASNLLTVITWGVLLLIVAVIVLLIMAYRKRLFGKKR
jgi:hypothetical protein